MTNRYNLSTKPQHVYNDIPVSFDFKAPIDRQIHTLNYTDNQLWGKIKDIRANIQDIWGVLDYDVTLSEIMALLSTDPFGGLSFIQGTGTTGYIPKWTDADTIGDSTMYTDGTSVFIGSSTSGVGRLNLAALSNCLIDFSNGGGYGRLMQGDRLGSSYGFSAPSIESNTVLFLHSSGDMKQATLVLADGNTGNKASNAWGVSVDSDTGSYLPVITASYNMRVGIGNNDPEKSMEISTGASATDYVLRLSEESNRDRYTDFSSTKIIMMRQNSSAGNLRFATANAGSWGAGGGGVEFMPNDVLKFKITVDGTINMATCVDAAADVDKFLVLDTSNNIDYRTGAEVLSDIGGAAAAHTHDGDMLQLDGVNSNGGAFSFTTTGAITFSKTLNLAAGTATAGTAPLKFTSGVALTAPEAGAVEYHNNRFYLTNVTSRRAIDRTCDIITATTTVANTTTETTIYTATIPANELKVGNKFFAELSGFMSAASAADTVTGRIKIGGVELVTQTSAGSGVLSDEPWHFQIKFTVRSVGATASIAMHTDLQLDGNSSTDSIETIDTTASCDLTVTVEWNNAKAGNSCSITQGAAEYKG